MNATDRAKAAGTKHVAQIDQAELAVRMCEASYGLCRPPGMNARQALAAMEDESREGWMRASVAAMEYWRECIQQMRQTS
jgi:hypothetical protein